MTKTDFHPHEHGCRFGFDVEMLCWSCGLYLYMKINGTDIYNKSVKESKSSMINKLKTSNLDRSIHLCVSPRSFLLFLKIKQWQKVE